MISITIEIRENPETKQVSWKGYATPNATATKAEHNEARWYMDRFNEQMQLRQSKIQLPPPGLLN